MYEVEVNATVNVPLSTRARFRTPPSIYTCAVDLLVLLLMLLHQPIFILLSHFLLFVTWPCSLMLYSRLRIRPTPSPRPQAMMLPFGWHSIYTGQL